MYKYLWGKHLSVIGRPILIKKKVISMCRNIDIIIEFVYRLYENMMQLYVHKSLSIYKNGMDWLTGFSFSNLSNILTSLDVETLWQLILDNYYDMSVEPHISPMWGSSQSLVEYWIRTGDSRYLDIPWCMHRSTNFLAPPNAVDFLWSCDGLWMGLSFVFSRSDCHLTI